MTVNDKLRELVQQNSERVLQLRRQIHANPELSYEEEQTAALVAKELKSIGLEVVEHIAGRNGVVAIIHGRGPGKNVALRADMDALSAQENTGLPFASTCDGKMHACGHDAHTAMLLGAAHVLADLKDSFDGDIRLVFQPGEEKTPDGGAKAIVASGVLGKVDAIYGLHVWPQLPTGTVGVKAGPLMAASDNIIIKISGKSSHGAMPHKGIDAIAAVGQFITAVQNTISRQINPLHPAVLTFGKIYGGSRYNIIAEEVTIEGTCRTYHKETQDYIENQLSRLLQGIDTIFGTNSTLQYNRGYSSLINDAAQTELAAAVIKERFGNDGLEIIEEPAMTAEDFSGYLDTYKGAFLWLGTGKPGTETYPLHNSQFTIDEDCLPVGVELLSALALSALSK
jgi:amidohydrolase